ncbi:MAG: FAD binding domain-containing protein [Anaerolineae bacterium]|nr:FAD binding domain-containing protein [Anaerolineae bacterium]
MPYWKHYHTPQTVSEALSLLASYEGQAQVIGGGTDLLIDLQHSGHEPPRQALVDVTRIPEMTAITEANGVVTLGAGVTHTAITRSALLEQGATCLVESCGVVGGPQVRNVGTLGGNVAHALPAGDGTTSLMALDAEAEVAWQDGRREWLPIAAMYKGPGVSALDPHRDVLVRFRFKLAGPGEASAFRRIMRPQGVALPVLGCAAWVKLDDARAHYADARICISPVARTPVLAEAVQDALRGQPVDNPAVLAAAVQAAFDTLQPRTSKYRATAEYRRLMFETLLRAALPRAVDRAQTGQARAEGVGLS